MFNLILEYSKNRPLQKMIFEDERTGRTAIEKYELDVAKQVYIMDIYFIFVIDLLLSMNISSDTWVFTNPNSIIFHFIFQFFNFSRITS